MPNLSSRRLPCRQSERRAACRIRPRPPSPRRTARRRLLRKTPGTTRRLRPRRNPGTKRRRMSRIRPIPRRGPRRTGTRTTRRRLRLPRRTQTRPLSLPRRTRRHPWRTPLWRKKRTTPTRPPGRAMIPRRPPMAIPGRMTAIRRMRRRKRERSPLRRPRPPTRRPTRAVMSRRTHSRPGRPGTRRRRIHSATPRRPTRRSPASPTRAKRATISPTISPTSSRTATGALLPPPPRVPAHRGLRRRLSLDREFGRRRRRGGSARARSSRGGPRGIRGPGRAA